MLKERRPRRRVFFNGEPHMKLPLRRAAAGLIAATLLTASATVAQLVANALDPAHATRVLCAFGPPL